MAELGCTDKYNSINDFKLTDYEYLFFDIFARNGEVVAVCPIYTEFFIIYENVEVYCGTTKLKQIEKHAHAGKNHECVANIVYKLEEGMIPKDGTPVSLEIEVKYEHNGELKTKKFDIEHVTLTKKFFMTVGTLFKTDYDLFEKYYRYYMSQGVEYFFLYYNGSLEEEKNVKKYINRDEKGNILLIEWNYHYWNNTELEGKKNYFRHHAQIGQLNHVLYKYHKPLTQYAIFNDFDEYLHNKYDKLSDLVKKHNKENYVFYNHWTKPRNPYKFEDDVPRKVFITSQHSTNERLKYIAKVDNVYIAGVHYVIRFNKYSRKVQSYQSNDNMMMHFISLSKFYKQTRPKNIRNFAWIEYDF